MFDSGIPPTQVYKYGSLGCIDVKNVLEPLEFVLPKREVPIPVVDLSESLGTLSTVESELKLEEKLSEPGHAPEESKPAPDPQITSEPSSDLPSEDQTTDTTHNPTEDADLKDIEEEFLSGWWTNTIWVYLGRGFSNNTPQLIQISITLGGKKQWKNELHSSNYTNFMDQSVNITVCTCRYGHWVLNV